MSLFFPVVACQYVLLCVCDPGFKGHGVFFYFGPASNLDQRGLTVGIFLAKLPHYLGKANSAMDLYQTLGEREFTAPPIVIGDLLRSGPRTVSYSYSRDTGFFFVCLFFYLFPASSSSVPSSGGLCYNFPAVQGFCSMKKTALKVGIYAFFLMVDVLLIQACTAMRGFLFYPNMPEFFP